MRIRKGKKYICIKDGVFKCNDLTNHAVHRGDLFYAELDGVLAQRYNSLSGYVENVIQCSSNTAEEFFEEYMSEEAYKERQRVRDGYVGLFMQAVVRHNVLSMSQIDDDTIYAAIDLADRVVDRL